jgi:hypothetical protein
MSRMNIGYRVLMRKIRHEKRNMVVNTAADSDFFLKLVSLIGSIRQNDSKERLIRIWNIGLTKIQTDFLEKLEHVEIKGIHEFMKNWQTCYCWKIYIFKHIPEDISFYLDTGMSVVKNLDCIENYINRKEFFAIGQGTKLFEATPDEYWELFDVDKEKFKNDEQFSAGLFGFKKNKEMNKIIDEAYELTLKGYSLGYSEQELYRDKFNVNIVRKCPIFRHDQTLINLIYRKYLNTPDLSESNLFESNILLKHPKQVLWWHRSLKDKYIFSLILNHKKNRVKLIFFLYKLYGKKILGFLFKKLNQLTLTIY